MNMLNFEQITNLQNKHKQENPTLIREILAKAKNANGLNLDDVAALTTIKKPELLHELFTTAKKIKQQIYGNRLVLFAPLYISNLCNNECLYCAFRASNKALKRSALNQQQIKEETLKLLDQGQKRALLVAGESYPNSGFQYILDSIKTIYETNNAKGDSIRRINVNLAPLPQEEFNQLKKAEIGTYQLFQETYHPDMYKKVHIRGKKADYNWRITAIDRAMQAGIDDVGIGVLFGLANWRFELLALMQHTQYLEQKFGVGPHTISVPRLEPASGSDLSKQPPNAVNDEDFCKLIAILRLAVPFTGLIMSTRETPAMRRQTFELGISQISAGSKTNPGGYNEEEEDASQFSLGDHRPMDEVIRDVASLGFIPSFCTACYRLGRTGEHFMQLAKTGKIKQMCNPNALLTFAEYLYDYASDETKEVGEKLIAKEISEIPTNVRPKFLSMLEQLKQGHRDLYI
ncbi:MAG: [FeFe] hydrogenase H-cluster radical SAM maturase HydG [Gammaproteobacteria bacterium]|nr:[FeFe] hydrogenase H-cluster radical SAM maturase HydG [Gammaproteobacteria bacterium]